MKIQKVDTCSKIDQIIAGLKTRNVALNLIDVRQELKRSKKDKLYHENDTLSNWQ